MAATIIGPTTTEFPRTEHAPVVFVKHNWSDDWQFSPALELVFARVAAGNHDLSTCELRHRYGQVKLPWQSDFATHSPWGNGIGWWVQVQVAADGGMQPIFIGQVSGVARNVMGASLGPTGFQDYVAYGPGQILRKIHVSKSYWIEGAGLEGARIKEIGWLPDANNSDDRQGTLGNRTRRKQGATYLYGDTFRWNHYDYIEYLLHYFVNDENRAGPKWTLGGQADLLKQITEPVRMGVTQTVDEILRKMIPVELGCDYTVRPTKDGFEVFVYSLVSDDYWFGFVTLPKNPRTVRVKSSQTADNVRTRVIESGDQQYGTIRVLGRRPIVVCTLNAGPMSGGADWVALNPGTTTLFPKWDHNDLEPEYDAGAPWDGPTPEENDQFRSDDRFRTVYQAFGAPRDWDHWTADMASAAIAFDWDGTVRATDQYQNAVRSTLSWLPLRENVDYSLNPVENWNPPGHLPDFLPPLVWVKAPAGFFAYHWTPVDKLGIDVSVSDTDFGFLLNAPANHLLALNHFDAAEDTEHYPLYDYETLVATLAFEGDQRLAIEVRVAADPAAHQGVLEIEVPDAEFWWIAAGTVVGVNENVPTVLRTVPGETILRNDVNRLALVMAGAIARYYNTRARAEIEIVGLRPWGDLVGQIVTVIEEGGDTQEIKAPITAVDWIAGERPMTIIRTGFAD